MNPTDIQIPPDVEDLARQADAVALPPPAAGGAVAPEPGADAGLQADQCALELAPLLLLLGSMLSYAWPKCADVYSESACRQTARAVAPALIRAGWWTTGTDAAVYVVAAGALLSLGVQTKLAMDASRAPKPAADTLGDFEVPAT